MRYVFLIVLLAFPAAAADKREVFYGTWGTPKQCSRETIKSGGTVLSEPFEISADWLKQGQLWCRLNWYPIEIREDGFFSGAFAQCGEDSVRDYSLGMVLSDNSLTLRWDFPLSNGPLMRCSDT
ncbi:hypothetical protein F9L33_08685 [Amylibacter sp. SFDW26]|uniref:hypothetical protein n=1 Tax=Amylibacter sp. SFDW26 TaxID=2652722 RepID=UPI0012628D92|nr:hypothetical protein [Amylibacter sp. SFDW26]KAB7614696.1 hypothetical protein F9L33_08685 [Amylibacter sp. SFDW26]